MEIWASLGMEEAEMGTSLERWMGMVRVVATVIGVRMLRTTWGQAFYVIFSRINFRCFKKIQGS